MAPAKVNIRSKREFSTLPVTPGSNQISPMRKQPRQTSSSTTRSNNDAQDIVKQLKDMIDTKIDEIEERFERLLITKIADLEKKFEARLGNLEKDFKELKEEYNDGLNHVEQCLKEKITATWEYALQNEQYSRKDNVRIFGLRGEVNEKNLEEKVIEMVKENLEVELKPEDIEIVHRIGKMERNSNEARNPRPRAVIVKFSSYKAKATVLMKRRALKGTWITIAEDMAPEIAKRLKKLKEKTSVESAWFVNGKIRYKRHDDSRVKELRNPNDLENIE